MPQPSPGPRAPLLFTSLMLIVACGPKLAPEPPKPGPVPVSVDPAAVELEQRLAYLEQELEQARADAHVPGMAIAIVKDDAVIWARGFGVTDLDTNTPVSPETVFAIGSSTKAFSSTLAAMLVDEGKLDWDDPASKHLPGFELQVEAKADAAGEQPTVATIRDLLAHRSGFARMTVLWAGNTISRDEILRYATQARPVAPLRAEFHYNNVTYMAGSLAAANAAATSWEQLVRTRLLEPLHMEHSSVDYAAAMADPARATGYTWREDLGEYEPAPARNTDAIAPAGAIYSSVLDMSNWLRLQLGEGEFEGQRLVSASALGETQTAQIEIGQGIEYGMGWMLRDWNGKRVIEHGGNIDGYAASVALLPEAELGMVLLTNVGTTPLQSSAMNLVWTALLTDAYLPDDASEAGEDLSRFVGEYVADMPGFGGENFEVLIKDGKLAVKVPGQTTFLLEPPDPDDDEGLREFEATDTIAISFAEDSDGAIEALHVHQNGMRLELLRVGVTLEPEVSPGEVVGLLGNYRAESGMVLEVVIHKGRLAVDVPGQMVFDLELPDEKGDYHFRANYDFVVHFERDDSGEAKRLSLVQPGFSGMFEREAPAKTTTLAEVHRQRKTDRRAKAMQSAGIVHLHRKIELISSGLSGTSELWFDAQGRQREEVDFGPVGRVISVLHEAGGWSESVFDPRKQLTGVELRQQQLGQLAVLFGDWRTHYTGETLLRTTQDESGRKIHIIELRAEGLPTTTVHVDGKTGDIVELHGFELAGNGMRLPVSSKLSEYRVVAGMRLPHRIEVRLPESGTMIATLIEVETKLSEDPGRFVAMPTQ